MSLFELHEFIRRVLALNLSEPVWVKCELAQVKMSRGHCYLELVEKSEDGRGVIAKGGGVIWHHKLVLLRKKLGLEFDALMREGMQVMLHVKVDFHERYGLKLMVEDIDPAYSLGRMEMQKQATLRALKAAGLMDKNRELELPVVVQKLAVISSETAAGLQDFLKQLEANPYGYRFNVKLFPAAMQGANVGHEVKSRLRQIENSRQKFDAVVIIRGGGAKLDLAAFDGLEIARAVAGFPLPVVVGIGHEVDETVIDLVAHSSLKTPTAVAGFMVHRAMQFEAGILEMGNEVKYFAEQKTTAEKARLGQYVQAMKLHSFGKTKKESMMLKFIEREVPMHSVRILRSEKNRLEGLANRVELLRPETAFRRGFSLTSKNGEIITSEKQLLAGEEILTQLKSGKVVSIVKKQNDG